MPRILQSSEPIGLRSEPFGCYAGITPRETIPPDPKGDTAAKNARTEAERAHAMRGWDLCADLFGRIG